MQSSRMGAIVQKLILAIIRVSVAFFPATFIQASSLARTNPLTCDTCVPPEPASSCKRIGCLASTLKGHGYTAQQLIADGAYDSLQLVAADFAINDLKDTFGYAALKAAGMPAANWKQASLPAEDCKAAGFTAGQCLEAGYSPNEMCPTEPWGGFSCSALEAGSVVGGAARISVLTSLKTDCHCTANDLKAAGCAASELKAAGFAAKELYGVFDVAALHEAAGFTCGEIVQSVGTSTPPIDISIHELREGGCTAAELLTDGFTAAQLKDFYTPTALCNAGYTREQLHGAGVELGDIPCLIELQDYVRKPARVSSSGRPKPGWQVRISTDAKFMSTQKAGLADV